MYEKVKIKIKKIHEYCLGLIKKEEKSKLK
jgi:hypothetical protein